MNQNCNIDKVWFMEMGWMDPEYATARAVRSYTESEQAQFRKMYFHTKGHEEGCLDRFSVEDTPRVEAQA